MVQIMTIASAVGCFIAAATLSLTVCGQVHALTVYDVIQLSSKGYSDQDILTLIEATDSAFALKAEDIPRLIDLGVSETVIQAMLKARHVETPARSSDESTQLEPGVPPAIDHHGLGKSDSKSAATASSVYIASRKGTARKGFKAEPFEEAAAGGHHHRVLTLSGMQLFVLRDEGQYPSVAARGNAVVSRLEEAASLGRGMFQPAHIAGRDAVIFSEREGLRSVVIVSVSVHDAYTYQRRSGRRVSPELLAAYWSALLSDYWSIVIIDEPPARLTSIHEGDALQALYERFAASGASERSQPGDILRSLPRQEREHLFRLATTLPPKFKARSPPVAESP